MFLCVTELYSSKLSSSVIDKSYGRGSQQAACGPNPALQPFLVGPLSTL